MFERFTDRARRVVVLAQEEARMLNHNYIGTEHILLGLIHEGEGVAAKALESLGIAWTPSASRSRRSSARASRRRPVTSRSRRGEKVLESSLREAFQLGHNHIGTEHILLGLIREGEASRPRCSCGSAPTSRRSASRSSSCSRATRLKSLGPWSGGPPGGMVEQRLTAMEQRVGIGPDTSDLDEQIEVVRTEKEAAVDAQDFEQAVSLRDREKQLLADQGRAAGAVGRRAPGAAGSDRAMAAARRRGRAAPRLAPSARHRPARQVGLT